MDRPSAIRPPRRWVARRARSDEDAERPAPAGVVHDITMPKLGETVTEGTIGTWLKKAGDTVEMDDPLFEVSTDKVDSEIPSPYDGVLLEILVGGAKPCRSARRWPGSARPARTAGPAAASTGTRAGGGARAAAAGDRAGTALGQSPSAATGA